MFASLIKNIIISVFFGSKTVKWKMLLVNIPQMKIKFVLDMNDMVTVYCYV